MTPDEQHLNEVKDDLIKNLIAEKLPFEDFAYFLLMEVAARLSVERVSIWLMNPAKNEIECNVSIDTEHGTILEVTQITEQDFPRYFSALREEQVIAAEDARSHSSTSEFTHVYLIPHNIYSMLDSPFFVGGELGGIICCEKTGRIKKWTEEEIEWISYVGKILGDYKTNYQ